jgi:hypothetical protein
MKRHLMTLLLGTLCLTGSTYMVLESAGYFQKLYLMAGLSGSMGWYTAVLSEAFQLTLVVFLPNNHDSKGFKYFLVTIIVMIYFLSVFAAGMNVGKPLIERWSRMNQNGELFRVLKEEQQSLQDDLLLFQKQNQQLNTALTVKEKRRSYQEIKDYLMKAPPFDALLIQIELVTLWLLRVLIQLANLCCGRLLANIWSQKERNTPLDIGNQNQQIDKPEVIRKWKARYTRQDKGFIGIVELNNGTFLSISPGRKKAYKTYKGALKSFEGTPYQNKIVNQPTWGSGIV